MLVNFYNSEFLAVSELYGQKSYVHLKLMLIISCCSKPVLSSSDLLFLGKGNLGPVAVGHLVSSCAASENLQANLFLNFHLGV